MRGAPHLILAAGFVLVLVLAVASSSLRPAPAMATVPPDSEEQVFVTLINAYRVANGLNALAIEPTLQDSAGWMSKDMADGNYFSHTDSLGRDPFQRMAAFGYGYNTWMGENLAAGASSAQVAFDLWKGSPGHNANMLGPNYSVIGVARAYNANSAYGWYWTNDFGGYAPAPAPTPTPSPTSAPTAAPTASPVPTASPAATPTGGAPNDDPDNDGFITSRELFVGTDPNRFCGAASWPPDMSGDGRVTLSDILAFRAAYNATSADASYSVRFDLNADLRISILDIFALIPFFGKACVP